MTNEHESALRDQLIMALRGDQSHVDFESATNDFPAHLIGVKPAGAPHSAWQLLEHLRIAQHDILEFSRNPKHKSPKWPDGYWPKSDAPPEKSSWEASVAAFKRDAQELHNLVQDPKLDLFAAVKGGDGQTLLREVLVVAAHNSYHIGQLMFLKKTLRA